MTPAFQSHLALPVHHFAAAVGRSLADVLKAGELGELDIQDGMIDLWSGVNWDYFKKAVNLN